MTKPCVLIIPFAVIIGTSLAVLVFYPLIKERLKEINQAKVEKKRRGYTKPRY